MFKPGYGEDVFITVYFVIRRIEYKKCVCNGKK